MQENAKQRSSPSSPSSIKKFWKPIFIASLATWTINGPTSAQAPASYSTLNEAGIKSSLEEDERFYGKNNIHLYPRLLQLGRSYESQGRLKEAEQMFRQVMNLQEEYRKHDTNVTLDGFYALESVLAKEGKKAEAKEIKNKIAKTSPGGLTAQAKALMDASNDDRIASPEESESSMVTMGLFRESANAPPKMQEKYAREILTHLKKYPAPLTEIGARTQLAAALHNQGKNQEAETEFKTVVAIADKCGVNKYDTSQLNKLKTFYDDTKQTSKAAIEAKKILPIAKFAHGDMSETVKNTLQELLKYSVEQKNPADTKLYLNELLTVIKYRDGEHAREIGELRKKYGKTS